MYIQYRLARILNEEVLQKAEMNRLVNAHRTQSDFTKMVQKFFTKQPAKKRGKYGLQ